MSELSRVLRPAAVLRHIEVEKVVEALKARDVSVGGVWNASPGVWQRYDKPWDGAAGMSGGSKLVGTIGMAYGTPTRYDITIYRVTVSTLGSELGWTVDSLCDDALGHAGISLATCIRAELRFPPAADPFLTETGRLVPTPR